MRLFYGRSRQNNSVPSQEFFYTMNSHVTKFFGSEADFHGAATTRFPTQNSEVALSISFHIKGYCSETSKEGKQLPGTCKLPCFTLKAQQIINISVLTYCKLSTNTLEGHRKLSAGFFPWSKTSQCD